MSILSLTSLHIQFKEVAVLGLRIKRQSGTNQGMVSDERYTCLKDLHSNGFHDQGTFFECRI